MKRLYRTLIHYLFLTLMIVGSLLSLYFVKTLNDELTGFQLNYSVNKFKGKDDPFLQLFSRISKMC